MYSPKREGQVKGMDVGEPTPQLSEEVLRDAGRITTNFALLECSVRDLAHLLIGTPENIARTVTAKLSFDETLVLAGSLAKERVPNCRADVRKILKRVDRAAARKNAILRIFWESIEVCNQSRHGHASAYVRPVKPLSVEDLREIATELSIATSVVEQFKNRLSIELHK